MIWLGNDSIQLEKDEPLMRSCWECNSAHEHLKKTNILHLCFNCGKLWIFDKFIETLKTKKEFSSYMRQIGLNPGDSTTKIS